MLCRCYGHSLSQSLPNGYYVLRRCSNLWRSEILGQKKHASLCYCNWFAYRYNLLPLCHTMDSLSGEKCYVDNRAVPLPSCILYRVYFRIHIPATGPGKKEKERTIRVDLYHETIDGKITILEYLDQVVNVEA